VFEHEVSVRWRDVDALGHVNHAVFLTYLEEGRDAFYTRTLGADPNYVVVRLEVDLRAEVRYPDRRVTVRIEVERVGRAAQAGPVGRRGTGPAHLAIRCRAKKRAELPTSKRGTSMCPPALACSDFSAEPNASNSASAESRGTISSSH